MKKSIFTIIGLFAFTISFNFAHSAGFDCTQAQSWVEKTVCANTELSTLDGALAKKYQAQLTNDAANKNNIRQEQSQWLKFQRNTCKDESCLIQEYRERMGGRATLGTAWSYPVDFKDSELPGRTAFGDFYQPTNISTYNPANRQWSDKQAATNRISIHRIPGKPYLAIVDAELIFTNLHLCNISDHLAFWSKNHWVLNTDQQGETYELRLYPATQKGRSQLLLKDINNKYRELYCGMRGYFDGIVLESK
ncbi:lysozyme inhibitor LprI family protein [Neisseria zalophi]|uniref:DUF1311 domain-containing protein n=1 Tax=Neisseria zalophi TaxID=640030 RepID=A0A5J6PVL5_9NEIS|nr:lysozyme inhibitor LprI family protein [Neisseria zalophi]QEY26721.1 DUF1311 domain-containing protein [Neisseria zalophi]